MALSLRAWAPVFASLQGVMDPRVFDHFYPDWRVVQRQTVEDACSDGTMRTWVAIEDGRAVGFVSTRIHADDKMGEIYLVAVDPDFQQRGVATALTEWSLSFFRDSGMEVAMVETGGDPGHEPARRAYEASGFQVLPVARYFKKL